MQWSKRGRPDLRWMVERRFRACRRCVRTVVSQRQPCCFLSVFERQVQDELSDVQLAESCWPPLCCRWRAMLRARLLPVAPPPAGHGENWSARVLAPGRRRAIADRAPWEREVEGLNSMRELMFIGMASGRKGLALRSEVKILFGSAPFRRRASVRTFSAVPLPSGFLTLALPAAPALWCLAALQVAAARSKLVSLAWRAVVLGVGVDQVQDAVVPRWPAPAPLVLGARGDRCVPSEDRCRCAQWVLLCSLCQHVAHLDEFFWCDAVGLPSRGAPLLIRIWRCCS